MKVTSVTLNSVALASSSSGRRGIVSIEGLDGPPDVRRSQVERPSSDGQVSLGSAYWDARVVTIRGVCYGATEAEAYAHWVTVKNALVACLNTARTLSFVLPDSSTRTLQVKLVGGVQPPIEVGGNVLEYEAILMAEDPRMLAASEYQEHASSVTCNNGGNVSAFCVITVTGAITNPVITNTTTGEALEFTANGGTVVVTTEQLVITVAAGRVSAYNDGVNVIDKIDWPDSTFFDIEPGNNTITLAGSSTDGSTKIRVTWSDSYL
jgi:hypothetical protein